MLSNRERLQQLLKSWIFRKALWVKGLSFCQKCNIKLSENYVNSPKNGHSIFGLTKPAMIASKC